MARDGQIQGREIGSCGPAIVTRYLEILRPEVTQQQTRTYAFADLCTCSIQRSGFPIARRKKEERKLCDSHDFRES